MNPTKLVSHFSELSVIFYAIYKIQQICVTIGVTFLQIRPWKELNVCNVVPMAAGRRGLANSGEAGAALDRGRGGGGSRGLGAWFGALIWGGVAGGGVLGGSGRRPALCACFRRGEGAVGVTSGLGGFGRCSQSRGSAQTGVTAGGQGTSTVAAMGGAAEQGAEGRVCAAARDRLPFLSDLRSSLGACGPTGRRPREACGRTTAKDRRSVEGVARPPRIQGVPGVQDVGKRAAA
jgi:hypothetical protein